MSLDLIVALVAGFLFVALVAGFATSAALTAASPERRRLRQLATAGGPGELFTGNSLELVETVDPRLKMLPGMPKSPKEMGRLRRRLATAGYTSSTALIVFSLANLVSPVMFGFAALAFFGLGKGWILAIIGAPIGYLIP